MKRGMFVGKSNEEAESLARESLKAITDLILAYPPKPPRSEAFSAEGRGEAET